MLIPLQHDDKILIVVKSSLKEDKKKSERLVLINLSNKSAAGGLESDEI